MCKRERESECRMVCIKKSAHTGALTSIAHATESREGEDGRTGRQLALSGYMALSKN